MMVVYVALVGLGCVSCATATVWSIRTRHERKVWRSTRHDTEVVAIVLELEERVHELDARTTSVR